ncbi:MAG: hypothetical protein CL933_21930 [Deltaproteobacteria bacterium]|nr:hypothetical protein [Deltaproteobacteria bacterium]
MKPPGRAILARPNFLRWISMIGESARRDAQRSLNEPAIPRTHEANLPIDDPGRSAYFRSLMNPLDRVGENRNERRTSANRHYSL